MATIRDVAREAGVSIGTVSRVLNDADGAIPISEDTRQKVLRVARELDYHPNLLARRLVANRSMAVGVVLGSFLSLEGSVNARILEGLGERLEQEGYTIQLLTCSRTGPQEMENELVSLALGRQVDGFLIWTERLTPGLCHRLNERKIPHLHIQSYPGDKCHAVLCDNLGGAYSAARHLLEQGYRRIAIIIDPDSSEGRVRLEGYKKALEAFGVQFDPDLVLTGTYSGAVATSRLGISRLKETWRRCDAIFATSDVFAVAAKEALEALDLKAGVDRGLVGFDDLELARHTTPPLTTVRQEGVDIGRLAALRILQAMEGKLPEERYDLVPTKLIVRDSSSH